MSKEIRNLGFVLLAVLVIGAVAYQFLGSTPKYQVIETENAAVATAPMVGNLAAAHSFSSGPIDAKVTVVEFFDPECESCAAVAPYIKNEMKFYEGKVRWVFRYMTYHHNSKTAAKVLEAARKQNKFLEVQGLLFAQQSIWGEKQVSTEAEILKIASHIETLDMAQLKKDMQDPAIEELIAKDVAEGKQAGVTGTPSFFVNGVILNALDMDALIKMINDRL